MLATPEHFLVVLRLLVGKHQMSGKSWDVADDFHVTPGSHEGEHSCEAFHRQSHNQRCSAGAGAAGAAGACLVTGSHCRDDALHIALVPVIPVFPVPNFSGNTGNSTGNFGNSVSISGCTAKVFLRGLWEPEWKGTSSGHELPHLPPGSEGTALDLVALKNR